MAGNVRGILNVRFNPDLAWQNTQEQFVSLYKAFVQLANGGAGPVAIHASYYGNSAVTAGYTNPGAVGTGMDYWDGAAPCGEGAFFVVRWKRTGEGGTATTRTHSYYMLFQWTRAAAGVPGGGGSGYTLPAKALPLRWARWEIIGSGDDVSAFSLVGCTMAMGDNGAGTDLSPWAGSTNADGTDHKGSVADGAHPVWENAGNVVVFPRCNGPLGECKTNRHALVPLYAKPHAQTGGAKLPVRMEVRFDDDHCLILNDSADSGAFWSALFGPYTPARGLTIAAPFVMMMTDQRFMSFGNSNTARNSRWQAGLTQADLTLGCRGMSCDAIWDGYLGAYHQPTKQTTPQTNSCYPLQLSSYEDSVCNGEVGYIDTPICVETSRCTNIESNTLNTRIVIGWTNDFASTKILTVWDGTSTFGASPTRDGKWFSVAP